LHSAVVAQGNWPVSAALARPGTQAIESIRAVIIDFMMFPHFQLRAQSSADRNGADVFWRVGAAAGANLIDGCHFDNPRGSRRRSRTEPGKPADGDSLLPFNGCMEKFMQRIFVFGRPLDLAVFNRGKRLHGAPREAHDGDAS
jgi:hypothetical protein